MIKIFERYNERQKRVEPEIPVAISHCEEHCNAGFDATAVWKIVTDISNETEATTFRVLVHHLLALHCQPAVISVTKQSLILCIPVPLQVSAFRLSSSCNLEAHTLLSSVTFIYSQLYGSQHLTLSTSQDMGRVLSYDLPDCMALHFRWQEIQPSNTKSFPGSLNIVLCDFGVNYVQRFCIKQTARVSNHISWDGPIQSFINVPLTQFKLGTGLRV